jgi:hypothetical protein
LDRKIDELGQRAQESGRHDAAARARALKDLNRLRGMMEADARAQHRASSGSGSLWVLPWPVQVTLTLSAAAALLGHHQGFWLT